MATKAELEAELAELRKLYSESQNNKVATPKNKPLKAAGSGIKKSKVGELDREVEGLGETMTASKTGDMEVITKQILEELEGLPEKKPLLTAIGAFMLGYLLGRSR